VGKKCSESGCEREVLARGLCSKHYQRARRSEQPARPVGRPRQYPKELAEKYQGAPTISVRLAPELLDWVKGQGGATWLRHATRELRELAEEPRFAEWWERLSLSDDD
jgi:hypothetical protein